MLHRRAFSPLRPVFPLAGLALFPAATAIACLQGHRFDSPKPVKSDVMQFRQELEAPVIASLRESAKIDLAKPEIAKPVIEMPALFPVPLASAPPPPPSPFATYVREFELHGGKYEQANDPIDYAVALIHLGRYNDAIATLEAHEKAQPGLYETAANLGTAFELAGRVEDATVWIARGMERKADSHAGTEWLHLAILQAKLALRGDPAWLKTHSVLDSAAAKGRSAEEIVHAIDYQLGERLNFVAPPDAIVCDLFSQAAARVAGDHADLRRAHYRSESQRFGEARAADLGGKKEKKV